MSYCPWLTAGTWLLITPPTTVLPVDSVTISDQVSTCLSPCRWWRSSCPPYLTTSLPSWPSSGRWWRTKTQVRLTLVLLIPAWPWPAIVPLPSSPVRLSWLSLSRWLHLLDRGRHLISYPRPVPVCQLPAALLLQTFQYGLLRPTTQHVWLS